jgi:hypothetical protein
VTSVRLLYATGMKSSICILFAILSLAAGDIWYYHWYPSKTCTGETVGSSQFPYRCQNTSSSSTREIYCVGNTVYLKYYNYHFDCTGTPAESFTYTNGQCNVLNGVSSYKYYCSLPTSKASREALFWPAGIGFPIFTLMAVMIAFVIYIWTVICPIM